MGKFGCFTIVYNWSLCRLPWQPTLGRVKLVHLIPSEGLPLDAYKLFVSTLSQSLVQYSAAIIQLTICDASLLRSFLETSRLYFLHKPPFPSTDIIDDSRKWCKTSGYHADPQMWQETCDFRPGVTFTEPTNETEIPPSGLVDIFGLLGKVCGGVLDAMTFYLNLRSSPFTEILDNLPLRNREVSSSVLSVYCHGRPSFMHHNIAAREDGQLVMFSDPDEHQVDRTSSPSLSYI
ncbi:uncharacterized protein LOC142556383 [Primulina tabacum]|uniref:uncharacterized protein LOC142556383 n=1 Tax=Primulina tabacum TaxID=48773 RepID=UPI003F5AABC1